MADAGGDPHKTAPDAGLRHLDHCDKPPPPLIENLYSFKTFSYPSWIYNVLTTDRADKSHLPKYQYV